MENTDKNDGTVEADFEQVSSNLPADPSRLYRHDLKRGTTDSEIQQIATEYDLDLQLGLHKQADITSVKALRHDIDQLTSSQDYFEVSEKLLEKLFQIGKLRRKCLGHNIFNFISGFIKMGWVPLLVGIITLVTIYPMIAFTIAVLPWKANSASITMGIFNLICWGGWVTLLYHSFARWNKKKLVYSYMSVKLGKKRLSEVNSIIPYGAKLKVLEAKETSIFQEFMYVTPEFEVKGVNYEIDFKKIFPALDPAILGKTSDSRLYMIVYWDIEKDIARVIQKIAQFKKFKLKK